MGTWNNSVLQFAKRIKAENNLSWAEVAEVVSTDFDLETTGEALRKAISRRDDISLLLDTLPDPTPRKFSNVLTLPADNALLVGDLHVDYYDREFLKVALRTAEQFNCKGIIIGGDLFNGGELSTHPKDEPTTPFKEEMEMVGKVISVLANLPWVEWVGITNGNHDRRYTKKLNAYATLESLVYGALAGASITAKLYITDYDYAYYGDTWGVGHLSSWSKDGGKLALDQAKRHDKRVFAVWHDHIQGIQADNERVGISVGSMLIENSQFYKERHLNKFNPFVNGFLISNGGTPVLFNKQGIHPMCKGI